MTILSYTVCFNWRSFSTFYASEPHSLILLATRVLRILVTIDSPRQVSLQSLYAHMILDNRPSRFSRAMLKKLGVAWDEVT